MLLLLLRSAARRLFAGRRRTSIAPVSRPVELGTVRSVTVGPVRIAVLEVSP